MRQAIISFSSTCVELSAAEDLVVVQKRKSSADLLCGRVCAKWMHRRPTGERLGEGGADCAKYINAGDIKWDAIY